MVRVTIICLILVAEVNSYGMLLLYRPRDITNECVSSRRLRYDISHGMGMSDTMTLVFRNVKEVDYECSVDIVTEPAHTYIITVIKFPGTVGMNCNSNHDAFTVMKKRFCYRICDAIGEADELSPYFVTASKERIRFRFLSNSSINSDINANQYQVTVTSARKKPLGGCLQWNETICNVGQNQFCFTHGVVCDGINNCGVTDWFDERKSGCDLPTDKLSFPPVIAVMAAIICTLLAAGHILLRCLPPLANSFFIFNANEDNRLCIDPVFRSPGLRPTSLDKSKRISLIPVSSSTSSNSEDHSEKPAETGTLQQMTVSEETPHRSEERVGAQKEPTPRKMTLKSITEKLQKKFSSKMSSAAMHV